MSSKLLLLRKVIWRDISGDVLKYTLTGQELAGGNSLSMTKATDRDVYIIFIHPLKNGLFRIHIQEYERTQTK